MSRVDGNDCISIAVHNILPWIFLFPIDSDGMVNWATSRFDEVDQTSMIKTPINSMDDDI